MRSAVFSLLRDRFGEYVSGEDIARQLMVSRTAIWNQIQALKREDCEIEAHSRLGYRLVSLPDRLWPEEIKPRLTTRSLGQTISYHREVDSTNTQAKKLANAGGPEGLIVVAETQTAGRGRLARGWFAPFGKGIWFSLVLRPPFGPQEAPKCTLMAAVAVNKAIRRIAGVTTGIKWPNDILYNGKKLVGILTEMSAEMEAINYVVIGIGINVNIGVGEFPSEMSAAATSLAIAAGRPVSRLELLIGILAEFERLYEHTVRRDFATVLDEWRAESVTLGQSVAVMGGGQDFSGLATDIDDEGALLVQTESGLKRVVAGDVSIRPAKEAGR